MNYIKTNILIKIKKITKKEINTILRTGTKTEIHALASRIGINANDKMAVYHFIQENAKTNKVYNSAYRIALCRADFKSFRCYRGSFENVYKAPILEAINYAKRQKKDGTINTEYRKILIEGNKHIYWAHPGYKHSNYNKSIAFNNTKENRRKAIIINNFLLKN